MAVRTANLCALGEARANSSFYEKLNTEWHKPALQLIMAIVIGHWGEHLFQAYQV